MVRIQQPGIDPACHPEIPTPDRFPHVVPLLPGVFAKRFHFSERRGVKCHQNDNKTPDTMDDALSPNSVISHFLLPMSYLLGKSLRFQTANDGRQTLHIAIICTLNSTSIPMIQDFADIVRTS